MAFNQSGPRGGGGGGRKHRHEDEEQGKLFVGGLSWDTNQESLLQFFSRYGEVIDCVVMKNAESGRSRGFGFVTFRDPNNIDVVLANGPHQLDGRTIDPKACNPRSMQKPKRSNYFPKVFLGGLPSSITETDLRNFFSRYGEVCEVVIMYDQEKKKSRGFGFLSFGDEGAVQRACAEHFVNIQNKQVEIKRAEPRTAPGDMGKEPPPVDQWGVAPAAPNGHPIPVAASPAVPQQAPQPASGSYGWGAPPHQPAAPAPAAPQPSAYPSTYGSTPQPAPHWGGGPQPHQAPPPQQPGWGQPPPTYTSPPPPQQPTQYPSLPYPPPQAATPQPAPQPSHHYWSTPGPTPPPQGAPPHHPPNSQPHDPYAPPGAPPAVPHNAAPAPAPPRTIDYNSYPATAVYTTPYSQYQPAAAPAAGAPPNKPYAPPPAAGDPYYQPAATSPGYDLAAGGGLGPQRAMYTQPNQAPSYHPYRRS